MCGTSTSIHGRTMSSTGSTLPMDSSLQRRLLSPGWAKVPQREEGAGPYLTWKFRADYIFGIVPRPIGGSFKYYKIDVCSFCEPFGFILCRTVKIQKIFVDGKSIGKKEYHADQSIVAGERKHRCPDVELLFSSVPHF